jgi:hypothetical protein
MTSLSETKQENEVNTGSNQHATDNEQSPVQRNQSESTSAEKDR